MPGPGPCTFKKATPKALATLMLLSPRLKPV